MIQKFNLGEGLIHLPLYKGYVGVVHRRASRNKELIVLRKDMSLVRVFLYEQDADRFFDVVHFTIGFDLEGVPRLDVPISNITVDLSTYKIMSHE